MTKPTLSDSTGLYSRLNTYSTSAAALLAGLLWGLAEATVFFIVPDVYIGLVALFDWRKGLMVTWFALAGSMLGGALMYFLSAQNPAMMNHVLLSIPLIHQGMLDAVRSQLQTGGLWMMVTGPKEGIPYKVYAVQAGIQNLPVLEFLLITIPARMGRFLLVGLIVSALGVGFREFVRKHTRLVLGVYAAFWILIYLVYYLRFRSA